MVVSLGLPEVLLFPLPLLLKLYQRQSRHHRLSVLVVREQLLPSHLKSLLKPLPLLHPFPIPPLQHRLHRLLLVLPLLLPLFLLPTLQSANQQPLLSFRDTNLRRWRRQPPRSLLWGSLLHPRPLLLAPLQLRARLGAELWVWSRPIKVIRRRLRDRVPLSLRHSAQTAR